MGKGFKFLFKHRIPLGIGHPPPPSNFPINYTSILINERRQWTKESKNVGLIPPNSWLHIFVFSIGPNDPIGQKGARYMPHLKYSEAGLWMGLMSRGEYWNWEMISSWTAHICEMLDFGWEWEFKKENAPGHGISIPKGPLKKSNIPL